MSDLSTSLRNSFRQLTRIVSIGTLLIALDLPLESVGLEEECRRIEKVSFFDLDECHSIPLTLTPLDHVLESGNFYISKTFDLTKRVEDKIQDDLQRAQACQPRSRNDSAPTTPPCPHHSGIPIYVWNKYLLQPLLDLRESLDPKVKAWFDSRSFALPIVEGFYEQKRVTLEHGERVTLTVVSRQGRAREGTRFEKRGIDSNGDVSERLSSANYCFAGTDPAVLYSLGGSICRKRDDPRDRHENGFFHSD